ncbi:hypothetical protein BZG36_00991 [Bifiguratus adelaidae]|uniref:Golgi apparatus membrane protein TVP38 n=1 Tax=Bifiguratus adelaidae TaxID=1938954 RepID=A0A261Y6F6_9FUNG|nr:hypothetical protein BZG36_00991 [Bifiguratus adelaidae]
MLSGFTFGFTVGLIVAYSAALIGGTLCFLLARRYLQRYIRSWFKQYRHLEAVLRAVEKRGLKLLVLIRVAPYPYNIMNVLLATTTVSTGTFILGTALSLIKIALHVFIGANLTSFTRPNKDEDPMMHTVRIVVMIAGFVFGLAVMVYMYRLTQKLVDEVVVNEGLQEAEEGLLGDEWGWEEDAFLAEEEEEREEAIVHPTNHT